MYFLSHMLRVCHFCILIKLMNGYLLFAANLEDFQAIAKKMVPDTLADSLTRIAYKPSIREKAETTDNESEEESSEDNNDSLPPIKGVKEEPLKGIKDIQKKRERYVLNQGTKVNFEELVKKVKQRLAFDLKKDYLGNNKKEYDSSINEKQNKVSNLKRINVDNNQFTKFSGNVATYNKKQNVKKAKMFSVEEMLTFPDEQTYTERNVAEHNVKKQKMKNSRDVKEVFVKNIEQQYNVEEMSPFVDEPNYKEDIFNKPKMKQEIKTEIERYDYADAMPLTNSKPKLHKKPNKDRNVKEIQSTTDGFYKKMEMTQNDSYEDYVTPTKDTNFYASMEVKQRYNVVKNKEIQNPIHNRHKIEAHRQYFHKKIENSHSVKPKTINYGDAVLEKSIKSPNDYGEKVIESKEIKAQTGNLWYDNNEKASVDTIVLSESSKSPKYGTRLPTRHTYKMATPNVIANLPVVVEKYNFDEPIPERDRERQTLKYVGNPPASINKKVRLI